MALQPGDKLGPYEIIAPIGKGGMGEVYRAHDPRLKRDVAIKVSAAQFSERFEREAQAIAALNHPNICQLYDVGPNYLVMEYIEGTPLKGPLPVDQALKYAAQICDALDAAHKKGITHRDLKPANILVTKAGIKLLDFGLAKLGTSGIRQAPKPDDATLTMALTGKNEIVGTLYYMSPEQLQSQASGQEIDARSDIFSFGLVLYEMLTGKRAFEGSSPASVIAAIMERPAPSITNVAPLALDRVLKTCLAKDPDERWQSVRDVKRELEWIASAPESGSVVPALPNKKSLFGWIMSGVAALAIICAIGVSLIHFREVPPPEQTLRSTISAPENSSVQSFAISPDGRTLAIAATVGGKRQLWLRPMDALQAQPMAFTEDATYPFWSPDSRNIGFFAQGKLKKVAASGGPAQSLCEAPNGHGGSWNRDDVIVFSPLDSGTSIQRISANGGAPADATKSKGVQLFPVFLPGGSHFLYEAGGVAETTGIRVSSLDGRENRPVLADASGAVFAPSARGERTGHILFVRENTLMAAPFDPVSAQVSGDVVPVSDGVPLSEGYLPATVSDNRVLLYAADGSVEGQNQIGWFDRAGKSLGPVGVPGAVHNPAISPDEKSVAFSRTSNSGNDLWVRDLSRGTETRFTSHASSNITPFWSPNGDRIVFSSNRTGAYNLYQKATGGSGRDEPLLPNDYSDLPTQWSRDGRFIVYRETDPKTKRDVRVLPTEGAAPDGKFDRKPIPFLRTEANELFGQLSPDGHWMAFTSDRSGKREVYVRPFPPGEGEWTISLTGGEMPRWSGDGKELFFEAADGKMMAVSVKAVSGAKSSFEAGAPVPLFDAHMVHLGVDVNFEYDVTADGKRFLINTAGGSGAAFAPPLTVVTNWTAGLKK
jgi:eukaryotic-like serine/threonine-protein kinase